MNTTEPDNGNVRRFPRPHYASSWTPEERAAWLAHLVTLPDGTKKRYGDLTRGELQSLSFAAEAERHERVGELHRTYAEVFRRAANGDEEAAQFLREEPWPQGM